MTDAKVRKIHPTRNQEVRDLTTHIRGAFEDFFRARTNGLEARGALTPQQWKKFDAAAHAAAIVAFHYFSSRFWRDYRKVRRTRAKRAERRAAKRRG